MSRTTPDLTDQRFGRLRVLTRDWDAPGPHAKWLCWCDCGTLTSAGSGALRSGMTKSCGCLHRERTAAANAGRAGRPVSVPVHRSTKSRPRAADPATWASKTRAYSSWANMMARCTNPGHPRYPDWGGRGITICDRWKDFSNFLADMGERPAGLSLNRRDNDGPYCPENCFWATPHEQQTNTRAFKLTPDVVREIKRLRATGATITAISSQVGLHRQTVSRALSGKDRSRKRD